MLYIDNREPQDIIDMFKRRNLAVEVKYIESGDYIMGNLAIERKTVNDLISSVTSGERHMWSQLETMRNTYEQQILLVEGHIDTNDRLLMGILTTIILFWKYQVLFTENKYDTAVWIEKLFTKYGVGKSNRIPPPAVKKAKTLEEIKRNMLCVIPRIGVKRAEAILKSKPYIGDLIVKIVRDIDKDREGDTLCLDGN